MKFRILSFIVVALLLVVTVGVVSAYETYNQGTDTICNNVDGKTICTKTIYSGIRNVFEDNQWKKIEDARSLKDKGFTINILEDDKDFPVEVVDFNYTSITVKLNPKGIKIFNENIPLRIWDVKDETSDIKDYKETYKNVKDEEIRFNLLNQEEDRTYNFGIGKILEFGYNSTTIQLQDADTENLDDTQISIQQQNWEWGADDRMYNGRGTKPFVKFNTSSIPQSSTIINATLTLTGATSCSLDAGETLNVSVFHIYEYPLFSIGGLEWTEGDQTGSADCSGNELCYLTRPTTVGEMDFTYTSDNILNDTLTTGGILSWNVTNILSNSISSSEQSVTLKLNSTILSGAPTIDESIAFATKEHITVNYRPLLSITYEPPPLQINITYPTNITYSTNVTFLNWSVGGVEEDYCWYSLNGGTVNTSLTCGDLYTNLALADGSHTIDIWTNDTGGTEVWDNVTFWMDTTLPVINTEYPTNTIYNTNITTFNYTYTETNPSYCWYSVDAGASNSSLQACGTNFTDIYVGEGEHTWTVFINDTVANENQDSITFWIDTVSPTIDTAYPTNTSYSTNITTFNYTYTEANPSYCLYSTDVGVTNSSLETCGTNFTSVYSAEGSNTFIVFINDTINNVNQSNITFWQDSINPVLNIEEPSQTFVWYGLDEDGNNTVSVDLNWTVSDTNLDACWYTNSSTYEINNTVTCANNATNLISYGTIPWTVFANDTLTNNLGSDTQTTRYAALINNSHVGNTTSYETQRQTFAVNLTYASSEWTTATAVFNYSGTTYAATKTGSGDFVVFTKALDLPLVGANVLNKEYNFNITLSNGTTFYYETARRNITVTPIIFQECNTTFNQPFQNFTFKDEETSLFIDASVPNADFDFWLGDGDVKDTYTFSDSVDTFSYEFCFSANETLHTDFTFQYEQDPGYPVRTETYVGDLTNATTYSILFLTGTSNGQYITFNIQDSFGGPISDVQIQVERKVGGAWTTISTDNADDAGQVTFYLDITLDHRLTISHSDYVTEIFTVRPSQSSYTVTLKLVGGDPAVYYSDMEGISYDISPKPGPWLSENTNYTFTYNVSANLSNLIFYSLNVTFGNGTELNSTYGTTSTGGNLSVVVDTANYDKIYGYYYIDIGNGTWLIDPSLYPIHDIVPGNNSIYMFFKNFKASADGSIDQEYTQLFFIFFILFLTMAAFTYSTGMELAQPGICLPLLFFFVMVASVGGFFTIDFVEGAFINKYGIALVVFFLTGGYTIGQWAKT